MKNILFILMLIICLVTKGLAQEQTFKIAHAEAPTENGFVYDNIVIHIKFEAASNGDTKIYVIPESWQVSYKYNGKVYKYGSAPFTSESYKTLFAPKYTSFDITLTNGKKLKANIWPEATKDYYYYDLLCCEGSYSVSKIELNTSQNFSDYNIESAIK